MSEDGNSFESLKADNETEHLASGFNLRELLIVTGIVTLLTAITLKAIQNPRSTKHSMSCRNNLKNIALALHSYALRNDGMFPPAYTVDSEDKPLHSWRTLILQDLDQRDLAEKIDLTKPWDDPVNAEFCKEYVHTYCYPAEGSYSNLTTYLAVVGPDAFLNSTEPRKMKTIINRGDTIGVIDMGSSQAVPWMSPQDADEHMVLSLGRSIKFAHPGGTNVAHPDGSVGFLAAESSLNERHKRISITGRFGWPGPP